MLGAHVPRQKWQTIGGLWIRHEAPGRIGRAAVYRVLGDTPRWAQVIWRDARGKQNLAAETSPWARIPAIPLPADWRARRNHRSAGRSSLQRDFHQTVTSRQSENPCEQAASVRRAMFPPAQQIRSQAIWIRSRISTTLDTRDLRSPFSSSRPRKYPMYGAYGVLIHCRSAP